ncbi:zinc-ribbon domain-containing protein, partial [Anaerosporobacter sp.]
MYCKHCGNLLDDDSKFCDKCGKYITDKPDEIQNKQGHTIKRKNIILIALVTIVCAVIISGLC